MAARHLFDEDALDIFRNTRRERGTRLDRYASIRTDGRNLQTHVGTQPRAVAIQQNAVVAVDALTGRERQLLKAFAPQSEQPRLIAHQHGAIGRLPNGRGHARRQPLRGCELPEAHALVAEDALFRHHPDEAGAVLIQSFDGQIREALFHPEIFKRVLLSKRPIATRKQGEQAQQNGNERCPVPRSNP